MLEFGVLFWITIVYLNPIQAVWVCIFESGEFWCGLYVVKSAVNHGRRCGYKWFELCTAVRKGG